jgi:WD40 repeat protein
MFTKFTYQQNWWEGRMQQVDRFKAHDSYVLGLTYAQAGELLVSSGMDNRVNIWDTTDWSLLRSLQGHEKSVNSIDLDPDEKVLATGSSDQTVKLWSFPEGEIKHELRDRKQAVASVEISPDGEWVAAGSYGGRAMIWSLDGEEVVAIKASQKNLVAVAFSPDQSRLATGGLGDEIGLWSLPEGEHLGSLSGHSTAVMALSFLRGTGELLSYGYEGTLRFWDAQRGEETRTMQPKSPGARGFEISGDDDMLAVSVESGVEFWSLPELEFVHRVPVETKVINGMAFSPDGRYFAAGAADRRIRIWELF